MKILLSIALSIIAAAEARACEQDRTAIEMAGHTLCLLNTAMPSISRLEDGSVHSLVWSHPERFPPEVRVPPGTFYLIVEVGQHNTPSMEETEPSSLPEMRQKSDLNRIFLYPQRVRINDQPFRLECNAAIAPHRKPGAQDCKIVFLAASKIRVEVYFGTVDWAGPAWPQLDGRWAEAWKPFLSELGAGINNLLSIQQ